MPKCILYVQCIDVECNGRLSKYIVLQNWDVNLINLAA